MSKQFQLKNGLKVILVESHKSPVLSVQMWVRTGSADERKKEEGISHFIEHLLFKGTEKYKTGEIASLVEGSGGELNAYTSFDQTVFYITISKHFSDVALDVLSEMMGKPLFDPTEIDNEREVVIEEIRQGKDSLGRVANQKMFSQIYKKHPYGIPVIGYDKVVEKVTVKTIKKYFAERYSAKNMFLVVAGDFDTKQIKLQIAQYFSDLPSGPVRKTKRLPEPIQKKHRLMSEKTEFMQAVGSISWRIPHVAHKDVPSLDILAYLLGSGDSSRLVHRMRVKNPVVNSVGSYAYTPLDPGIFSVNFNFEQGKETEILSILNEELIRICEEMPSQEEMQKVLTNIASEQIYSLETVEGMARNAGSFEFYFKNPEYYSEYLKKIHLLKPVDIMKAARKYFNPQNMSVLMLAKEQQDKLEAASDQFIKEFKNNYKGLKKRNLAPVKPFKINKLKAPKFGGHRDPEIHKIVLDNGATLLYKHEPETPTISIKSALLGGLRAEATADGGVAELFGRCFTSGTKNISEENMNAKIDKMAAGLQAYSGRNSCGLNMDFLSIYQDEMFALFGDVLANPLWDPEVVGREKAILKNQIKNQNDRPASICAKQFHKSMFAGHPYGKDMQGEESQVDAVTSDALKKYYNQLSVAGNFTLCAVGDIKIDEFRDRAKLLTSFLPKGKRFAKTFDMAPIKKDVLLFRNLNKEQTHIMLGYRGVAITDSDRFVVHLINAILAGQGGRLFLELRDKNSLAYSVYPTHLEGVEGGYFAGYISCAPDKVNKSVEMLEAEFNKLATNLISDEELQRAKRYIIGGHDLDLQRKSAINSSILFDDIYGIDYRTSLNADDKYISISKEDIQRVSERIFRTPKLISIVGSKSL